MVSVCAQLTSCGACLGKYCFWLGLRDDSCMCTKQYNSSSPDFMWVLKPGSRCQDYTGLYCDSSFSSSSSSPSYSTTELPVDPSYITTGHLFWIVVGALFTFTMFLWCCLSLLLKYHDRLHPIVAPISALVDLIIEEFVGGIVALGAGFVGIARGIFQRMARLYHLHRPDPREELNLNGHQYDNMADADSEDDVTQFQSNSANPLPGPAQNHYEEIPGTSFSSTAAAVLNCQQEQRQEQQQQSTSETSGREQPSRKAKLNTPGFLTTKIPIKKTGDKNKK